MSEPIQRSMWVNPLARSVTVKGLLYQIQRAMIDKTYCIAGNDHCIGSIFEGRGDR